MQARRFLFLLFCCLYLPTSFAVEFTSFKLGKELSETAAKRQSQKRVIFKKSVTGEDIQIVEDVSNSDEVDEDKSTMFNAILEELNDTFERIGKEQSITIIEENEKFNLGHANFSGFTWAKLMGDFSINVNRKLTPDIFQASRWMVTDTFELSVNAMTYLTNLKQQQKIEITDLALEAFAGVEFKRVYRYVHYANSFTDGLTTHFDKLFLSFLKFRGDSINELEPHEVLVKEDFMSLSAGARISTPPVSQFSFSAGAMISFNRLSTVTVHAPGPLDDAPADEYLRISLEKMKGKEVGAEVIAQVDFYNLLKLTLLSYEYAYEWKEGDKINLSFKLSDKEQLIEGSSIFGQIKKVLKMQKPNLEILKDYLVSTEDRIIENSKSKYLLLVLGGINNQQNEQVVIQQNGVEEKFFKTFATKIDYVENAFDKLKNAILSVFKADKDPKIDKKISRELAIEYQAKEIVDENEILVESEEDLSMVLTQEFYVRKTEGKFYKKLKDQAQDFLKKHTTISADIIKGVKEEKLRGPIVVRTLARLNKSAIEYFNRLERSDIVKSIKKICDATKSKKSCNKELTKKYDAYNKALVAKEDIELFKLKDFIREFHNVSLDKQYLALLFGSQNVFLHGTFEARTKDGADFVTFFTLGQFQGLGIIDSFRRGEQEVTVPFVAAQ